MATRELSDPILHELIKNALDTIVDEMAIALVRTAYSNNLKNAMDMSCALCDAEGRLIAQGLTLPLHLGSIPDAMARVRQKFAGRTHPGDVFILNDPYEGGTHLPDFYIFKPIFLESARLGRRGPSPATSCSSQDLEARLVGWSASIGHQLDVGGKTPGGNGCDATEIFQDGLRIPPLRLYAAGKPWRRCSSSSTATCACRARCSGTCARRWRPASPASAAISPSRSSTGPTASPHARRRSSTGPSPPPGRPPPPPPT